MKSLRLEYKFLVSCSDLDELREALKPFVYLDEYADREPKKEYTVRSIYFDTLNLNDYHEKLAGIKIRKKLRIRGYNQPNSESISFLEIKRKNGSHISKNRAPVLYSNLNDFLNSTDCDSYLVPKHNFVNAKKDANHFFYFLKLKNYTPIVLVTYDREAFYSKHDSTLRITFDKNLRSFAFPKSFDLYNDADLKKVMTGSFILELKFYSGYPAWLQKIVNRFALNRQALSKYTTCVENHTELIKIVGNKNIFLPNRFTYSEIRNWKEVVKDVG